jgi:multidrug efflux system membrane fusion protein
VVLHIESASFNEGAVLAPLSAIVASEENNDKFVFVYNAQSQKVERRQIEESGLVGKDNVIITKGLKAGDQVVSAGATRLVEGQQVKVLTD